MENQSQPEGEGGASTGTTPPPRPHQVDWKAAIRCALLVSGVAALLSLGSMRIEVLSGITMLWVVSASMITLSLYQRQRPAAWMDVRVGARIGVLVGMCLAVALGAVVAGWGVLSRFALHSMGSFDADMAQQMEKMRQRIPAEKLGFYMSPEFRAGIMAASFGMISVIVLVFSTLGGAFSGLLRMRRGPAA